MSGTIEGSSYTKVLRNQQTVLYIAAGAIALIAYDTCITLSEELRFVWETRWSIGKLLYVFIRYGTILIAIAGFYGSLYVDPSVRICRILTQTYTAGACFLRFVIDVNQLLRAVAIYKDDQGKRKLLLVVSISQIIILCALSIKLVTTYELIEYGFSGPSCALLVTYPRWIYISLYTFIVIPDLTITGACSFRIYQLWIGGESRVARIILRDSVVYMIALTLLAIPQFLTPLFLPINSTVIVSGLNFIIITVSGIASSRMNLNIRSVVLDPHNVDLGTTARTYCPTTTISHIYFDSSINEPDLIDGDVVP